jgi:Sec-independent protein translocase protein TatA
MVIFVVALLVLGPERLPDAARRVGAAMGEARRWSERLSSELGAVVSPPEPAVQLPAETAPPPDTPYSQATLPFPPGKEFDDPR